MVIVIKTIKRRTDIKNISIIGKTRCTDENVIDSSLPSIEHWSTQNSIFKISHYSFLTAVNCYQFVKQICNHISDALRGLVPFVQFIKRKKHP